MIGIRQLQQDEARSNSEADRIAETVQLCSEIGRLIGQTCGAAVEHVEQHRQEDQRRGRDEDFRVANSFGPDFGRDGNGTKAAGRVAERQQGWQPC